MKNGLYNRCHVLVLCRKVVGVRACSVDVGWMRLGWQIKKVFGNVEGAGQNQSISLVGVFYERYLFG